MDPELDRAIVLVTTFDRVARLFGSSFSLIC